MRDCAFNITIFRDEDEDIRPHKEFIRKTELNHDLGT